MPNVGWGMLLSLLLYDSFVNFSALMENVVGAIPILGGILATIINTLGGFLIVMLFFVFWGRTLWKEKYTLTTIVGFIYPFIPVVLPLTSLSFVVEKKALKGEKKGG